MEPYTPDSLPLDQLDFRRLIQAVGRANAELARYDGLLQGLVNPGLMLSPLMTQEAVLSSRIEGTEASLDEVLEHEAGDTKTGEKGKDIQEIINYRLALSLATEALADSPITLGLVRQMHKVLMSSVRGHNKAPGEFRKDQNWIGRPGCTIEEATFVPPGPLQLQDFLLEWEAYLVTQDIDPLVQTAIVHAQFELIHPFRDGNGRIGRLLIPLYLFQTRTLSQPMFYLSAYLEAHRDVYYERLRRISAENDWNGWIEFFLQAVVEQAKENSTKVRKIMQLYDEMKQRVEKTTSSSYLLRLLDTIFTHPIFSTTSFVKRSEIPRATALPLLRKLKGAGILRTLRESRGSSPEILIFPDLLTIVEGKSR
ncbi:MAG: Fic family protein [Caldilineaceae bacterium]|nr:Fic family protein [Caldilineaceae bacterium]